MTSHEEIQLELAAYAASRLERDAGRRLEEHLRGCQDCREMLETFVPFARALGEGGEALFEPHPSESTLRRYARAGKAAGMEDVARHLDFCASCSLQVGAWKRQADTLSPLPRWAAIALATAAGLAVGAGLSAWLGAGRAPGPPRQSLAETAPGLAEASAGPLLVLPRALRGEETSVTYALDPSRTFLVIACPASVPDSAPPGQLFRYEIRREGAGAVWSRILSAADVRRHLSEGAELVTLLVPNASLTPGRYEFRLAPAESPEESSYRSALVLTGPK
ncbi:MAG: hypothetical protein DMF51_01350 [Acidobacteria bacterium]|nr:MAG: hypothetical protein DMF51_01350 [Acidobacteriota bacterium]